MKKQLTAKQIKNMVNIFNAKVKAEKLLQNNEAEPMNKKPKHKDRLQNMVNNIQSE